MEEKLVSVCIPVYNDEKYIGRAIESVLNQSYKNIELLVVDNCSTDNTVNEVKKYKDERLRLICNDSNIGMTGNWKKAIDLCQGEYIKLIPSDDYIYDGCIAKSVDILSKHPEVTIVVAGTDLADSEDKVIGAYNHGRYSGIMDSQRVMKKSLIINNYYGNPVCTMFRKTDFYKSGGIDADCPNIPDFTLWLNLAAIGKSAFIREHLSAFRVRHDSNTGVVMKKKNKQYTKEHAILMDKHIARQTVFINRFERRIAIMWRYMRTRLIAVYIKIKA